MPSEAEKELRRDGPESIVEESSQARVMETLRANMEKNFVKRILEPRKWPVIDRGGGVVSTHLMAWATVGEDRKPIVYPTIIYDPKEKKLVQLPGKDAVDYALRTGEFIAFDDEEAADWFSREYKRGTPMQKPLERAN